MYVIYKYVYYDNKVQFIWVLPSNNSGNNFVYNFLPHTMCVLMLINKLCSYVNTCHTVDCDWLLHRTKTRENQ